VVDGPTGAGSGGTQDEAEAALATSRSAFAGANDWARPRVGDAGWRRPGDPTAHRQGCALQDADVVFYDELVSAEISTAFDEMRRAFRSAAASASPASARMPSTSC
jgi:uroporphyrin-III C-methyltransferase/precorrin-2 dehydrogenase/sirohydrochlorin ferrochelatase